MKNYIVSTLPIEIKDNLKIGTLTAVEYASLIAKKTGCKSMLYLNGFNSYRQIEHSTTELEEQLIHYGINIDQIVLDTEIVDENLKVLDDLFNMKKIVPQMKKVFRCKCGRVEMLREASQGYSEKKVVEENDGTYCRICNSECRMYEQEVLTFSINASGEANVIPQSTYANNFIQFNDQYNDSNLMISRTRKTGIEYKGFNIDVDFYWSLFIGMLPEKNVVIVSSNTHLFKLYIIDQIGKCCGKNTIFVIHPRIVRKQGEHISSELEKYDGLYRSMILLYSPKWKTQKCFYDMGTIKYLAKIRGEGRKKLFDYLCKEFDLRDYYVELKNWIEDEINLQDNIIEVMK